MPSEPGRNAERDESLVREKAGGAPFRLAAGTAPLRCGWRCAEGGPGRVLAGPGEGFRFPPGRVGLATASALAVDVVEVDGAEVVGGLGVLRQVDAGLLVLGRDPETHRLVDDLG